jgi:hypothetical protein
MYTPKVKENHCCRKPILLKIISIQSNFLEKGSALFFFFFKQEPIDGFFEAFCNLCVFLVEFFWLFSS